MLKLYFDGKPEMLRQGMRILHVAPEPPVARLLKSLPSVDYRGGDLEREFGPERIDVTAIDYPDGTFDAVICNHVLEHVPDDRRAMSEIRRVLKPGGWAVLLIPLIRRDATVEDVTVADPAERERLFGQHDHVRKYGWDFVARLRSAGLTPEVFEPKGHWSAADIERYRLNAPGGVDPIFVAHSLNAIDCESSAGVNTHA
jgi:SAM-dependent methyltransferase